MFKIEIIGKNPTCFYIKALGTFPQSVAKRFTEEFEEMTKDFEQFCAIVDISDFILFAFFRYLEKSINTVFMFVPSIDHLPK